MILVNFIYRAIEHDDIMEICDQKSSENGRDELIQNYVAICNRALEGNRNKFPFKQIFSALERVTTAEPVEVVVADTAQTYAFHFGTDGIKVLPHGDCEGCNCIRKWTTNSQYLHKVVTDPNIYIQNPAKLNWDWMYGD